jgi:hypothetical protein
VKSSELGIEQVDSVGTGGDVEVIDGDADSFGISEDWDDG